MYNVLQHPYLPNINREEWLPKKWIHETNRHGHDDVRKEKLQNWRYSQSGPKQEDWWHLESLRWPAYHNCQMGLDFLISRKQLAFFVYKQSLGKSYVHHTNMCKLHIRTVKVRGKVISITYKKAKPIQNQTESVQHPWIVGACAHRSRSLC